MLGPEFQAAHVSRDMEAIFGRAISARDPGIGDRSPAIKPIVSGHRARKNEALVPTGVVMAGALVISLVFAQPGTSVPSHRPLATASSSVASAVRAKEPPVLFETPGDSTAERKPPPFIDTGIKRSLPNLRPNLRSPSQGFAQLNAETPVEAEALSQTGSPCDGFEGSDLARCMWPEIRDADRRLRYAYYDAVRSGVDPGVLAHYQREWSRMRDEEIYDPKRAAAGYGQMAEDLEDE